MLNSWNILRILVANDDIGCYLALRIGGFPQPVKSFTLSKWHHLNIINLIDYCYAITFSASWHNALKSTWSDLQPLYQLNSSPPSAAYMRQWIGSTLVQIMACAYSAPSYYLNQGWIIGNWTPRNKFQWNFNQNRKLFIHENASENIVCKKVPILC